MKGNATRCDDRQRRHDKAWQRLHSSRQGHAWTRPGSASEPSWPTEPRPTLGIQAGWCHLSHATAAQLVAGGRPGSECVARNERSNERGRGAAGSPDPYARSEPRSVCSFRAPIRMLVQSPIRMLVQSSDLFLLASRGPYLVTSRGPVRIGLPQFLCYWAVPQFLCYWAAGFNWVRTLRKCSQWLGGWM
jgi:hypothetical protein